MINYKKSTPGFILSSLVGLIGLTAPAMLCAEPADISISTGAAIGLLEYQDDRGENVSAAFGCVPLGVNWYRGVGKRTSVLANLGTLLDVRNSQLVRQGVAGGFAYHILGTSRRYEQSGKDAGYVILSDSDLSVVIYGGMQNIAASNRDNTKSQVSGSVLEAALGLSYRQDFGRSSAFTAEWKTTLFTIPASVSRIRMASSEILFGWRFFV